jgi:hypothetical protein
LQDLPPVIDDIKKSHEYIVEMKYDISATQPVNDLSIPFLPSASRICFLLTVSQRVRVYYPCCMLYGCSNTKCREVLQHVVDGMEPGHSKLLIFEYILPDVRTPSLPTLLDIQMLAMPSGMEGAEMQLRKLLGNLVLEIEM